MPNLSPDQLRAVINQLDLGIDLEDIESELADLIEVTAMDAGETALARVGAAGAAFDISDEATDRYLKTRVGEKIVRDLNDFSVRLVDGINEETKTLLVGMVDRMVGPGGEFPGPSGFIEQLRAEFESMDLWRAQMIATTESALALNWGQLEGYKQAGIDAVLVLDGDNPDTDFECRMVAGMIISVDLAMQYLTGHPNCRRSFESLPAGVNPDELQDEDFIAAVEGDSGKAQRAVAKIKTRVFIHYTRDPEFELDHTKIPDGAEEPGLYVYPKEFGPPIESTARIPVEIKVKGYRPRLVRRLEAGEFGNPETIEEYFIPARRFDKVTVHVPEINPATPIIVDRRHRRSQTIQKSREDEA